MTFCEGILLCLVILLVGAGGCSLFKFSLFSSREFYFRFGPVVNFNFRVTDLEFQFLFLAISRGIIQMSCFAHIHLKVLKF